MKRRLALALLPALLLSGADASTLVYRESRGTHLETHTYRIEPLADGVLIRLTRQTPSGDISDEIRCDDRLRTLAWEYRCPATSSQWRAERRGDAIVLAGTHKGRPVDKTYAIDANPWKQAFSVDFAEFAAARGDHRFWSVGTSGPGEMKAALFVARGRGDETVRLAGREVAAVRLRVSLSGWRSMFWHGDYWFRRADWRYILYRGSSGLFKGDTVKELVSESGATP